MNYPELATYIFFALIVILASIASSKYITVLNELAVKTNEVTALLNHLYKTMPLHPIEDAQIIHRVDNVLSQLNMRTSEEERVALLMKIDADYRASVEPLFEQCRVFVEILPYVGILGTVSGLLLSLIGTSSSNILDDSTTGLTLALVSTVMALFCTISIKIFFESEAMARYSNLNTLLNNMRDYGKRFGGLD